MSRRRRQKQDQVTKEQKRRRWELKQQKINAAVRAKYGPLRRAAPVTVKSLDGEVLEVRDGAKFKRREYAARLNNLARDAGFDGYEAYLRSAYWAGVRARVLARDGHRCVLCGGSKGLSVHHDRYDYIGGEHLAYLKTICAHCHRRIHRA